MKFTQIRHATCIIEINGINFLIDPVLYKKNTLDPIKGGLNEKNPLVDINVDEKIIKNIDIILLTHLHSDHFDKNIIEYFGKNISIICSEYYKSKINNTGFSNVNNSNKILENKNTKIIITKCKHGKGIIGLLMGKSYGFIIKQENQVIYIIGDTIWYKEIKKNIQKHKPDYIIIFAGSAMIHNTHITMDVNDINNLLKESNNAKVVINHTGAWNHCKLNREELKKKIITDNVYIPNDGETIIL